MGTRLLVGLAEADEMSDPRRYLLALLDGLRGAGVDIQVAMFADGPVRQALEAVGDVRVFAPLPPRSPGGLVQSLARRLDGDVEARVHDLRTRDDLAWLVPPDAIHLHGPRAATLLHYVRTPEIPVVTYVHPEDFSIAGLDPADRKALVGRTRRFVVADDRPVADLLAAGARAEQIERAPRTLHFPPPPPEPGERARLREHLGVPTDGAVVVVPGVPDWIDVPDLTISLAWELSRRRGKDAPHLLWYGMPTSGEARWAIDADIERIGLTNLHLCEAVPSVSDQLALADAVVIPSRPTPAPGPLPVARAREHRLPVLCWADDPRAPDVASWTDAVITLPDVSAMASAVLDLVEDTPERRRIRNLSWNAAMTGVERLAPLEVPAP